MSTLNIYQKLAKIRKQVEVIKKNKSGYNYTYVTDDELLAKITAFMDKYNLSLIPSITPGTLQHEQYHYCKTKIERKTNQPYEEHNNEIIVRAEMVYSWINNENPEERVDVPWVTIGQQTDASQAFGSGLTYSMRYFLLKYFNVSTPEDDVDNWRAKQREAEAAEDKALAEQIVESIGEHIKLYLSNKPDDSEDVKGLVSKYVKNGDYRLIKESILASKLLSELQEKFKIKSEEEA